MELHSHLLFTTFVLIGIASSSVSAEDNDEDLLDEYVKHIDSVNQIPVNYREKRDVSQGPWTHSEVLDKNGDVVLRWQPRHQEILFRIEARTLGYISIGFSPDGGKENADIVMGWVDDHSSRAYLLDCHGVPASQGSVPVRDVLDNYTLMRGVQNDTHTILEFRRVLDTCDPDDYILTGDTVVVIWAYHDKDPTLGAEMIYHGDKRGGQSLHLLGPPPIARATGSNIRFWDVTLKNFEIVNNMNTIYWCKIFKAPTLNQKHHIIGYQPLIGNNHSNFVHHMILHECELDTKEDFAKWERYSKEEGRLCYGPMMSPDWEKCLTPLVAWAIGSKGENFPQHVGLPLASKQNSFYMLEVHFDNPEMKQSRDSSGLRLHYTNDLREHDGGILTTGIALSTLHLIPPHQKEYKTAGYCSMGCTKSTFPKDGVKVVSVMLHSHLAGRKMKLRHIRGGKELQPLAQDNHYDFNYQQSRSLLQDATILPGDGLITECTYSTVNRYKPTLGGYSTKEEMCLAFVLHYPRTELAGCYSMSPIKYFFETLGVREFYGKSMSEIENMVLHGESDNPVSPSTPAKPILFTYQPGDEMSPEANQRAIAALRNAKGYTIEGEDSDTQTTFDKLIIKEPSEFRNKSFMTHLQSIPYNESLLTRKMEEFFYTGLHLTFCRRRDDTLIMKESVVQFPNFTAYSERENQILCSYKLKRTTSSSADSNQSQLVLGSSEVYSSMWFAYNSLTFLNDRNKPRKRSNTASAEANREGTLHEEEGIYSVEEHDEASHTASPSSMSQPSPPKKKRPSDQKLDLLKQTFGILKTASESMKASSNNPPNLQNEEITYFCGFVANKMSKYSDIKKSSVQHAIHDILFLADRGYYEINFNNTSQYTPFASQGYNCNETLPQPQQNHPYLTTSEPSTSRGNTSLAASSPSPYSSDQVSLAQDSMMSDLEDLV